MANTLWTVNTGHSLGTIQESLTQTVALPVDQTVDSISLISGKLPGGLRLDGTNLLGTPFEVNKLTTFKFVLRAKKDRRKEDITLNLTIDGEDAPQWVTSEGSLPLGPNNRFYILDSSPVDFQLQVIDPDLPTGETLEYFIEDDGGELPPGISLGRTTGKLTGIVEPLLALEGRANQGYFDTNVFGTYPYDFGVKSFNGFESFYYDTTFYDYAVPTRSPKKLNRFYEFTVSVSDGVTITKRQFKIYLVGDDFLRTDNTIMQLATGLFTADNTYLRAPVWLTPSDLGFRRANNYVTLFLDVYDPTSNQGIISFTVKKSNPDGSSSVLPPGMSIDSTNGEIAGRVPYQPAVTTEYKFTIEALRQLGSSSTTSTEFVANNLGLDPGNQYGVLDTNTNIIGFPEDNLSFVDFADNLFKGTEENGWLVFNEVPVTLDDASDNKQYVASNIIGKSVWVIKNGKVEFTSTDKALTTLESGNSDYLRSQFRGTIPNVMFKTYDSTGAVVGIKQATISFYNYNKRITETVNPTVAKDKTFSVKLLGEVESAITWNTESNLGNIRANFTSTLSVSATSNVPNAVVLYSLDDGRLPPGITLAIDGQLQGKIRQFGEPGKPGLTTIDKATTKTTFDGDTTTIDRSYEFTVKAQDQFKFSATTRKFTITTTDPDDILYSSINMVPMLKQTERNAFRNFISDPTIFTPSSIYRPNDPTFGLQSQINILAYAGIETKDIREFMAAVAKNHKRKKYKLGAVKKALAKNAGSNDTVYEVIYLEVMDPAEPTTGETAQSFTIATQNKITTDSIQYSVTDDNSGVGTGQGFFTLGLRGGDGNSPASTGTILVYTRIGPVQYDTGNSIVLELQNGQEIAVADIDDSINADPQRLRPISNTIKIDSDAIKISDSKDQTRYISNITNMRNRLRAVGANLRDFYPLWMRTAQVQGEAELGFKLAIPLCYCKPGEADNVILNIANSNFNFKQLNIEIERYNIDATDGVSNEQYLPFANYQFNV
tara:strand:+ start:612 stop:3608 length:2997 start_codon:yes stop_codon:yes gene_type:complete